MLGPHLTDRLTFTNGTTARRHRWRHNELMMDLLVPLHISGSSILLLILFLPEVAHYHEGIWSLVISFLPRILVQPLKGASTAQVHDPHDEMFGMSVAGMLPTRLLVHAKIISRWLLQEGASR